MRQLRQYPTQTERADLPIRRRYRRFVSRFWEFTDWRINVIFETLGLMAEPENGSNVHRHKEGAWFTTTRWSVVLRARNANGHLAEEALEVLCRTYERPIKAYIRHRGFSIEDAEELTQEFLSRFVHKESLNHLRHQNGKFRSFLLTFLKNFLADHWDRTNAQKRGGGKTLVPLDAFEAEEREAMAPANHETPDQVYDRLWAQTVMEQVYAKLRELYAKKGQAQFFEQLKEVQPGIHGERSYKEIGATLGISQQAVGNAVLSFRRRFRRLLLDEIAQTVANSAQVKEELRFLMQIFAG